MVSTTAAELTHAAASAASGFVLTGNPEADFPIADHSEPLRDIHKHKGITQETPRRRGMTSSAIAQSSFDFEIAAQKLIFIAAQGSHFRPAQDEDFGYHCGSPTFRTNSGNRVSERRGSSKKSVFKASRWLSRS